MRQTKVLWISDNPLVGSGFGRVTKEITTRLRQDPSMHVACLGWGYWGWPYDKETFPCTIYPSQASTFGQDHFDQVVADFKPDIVVTLGELWAIDWLARHPARRQFKWVGYVPIDAGPFYPPWESILKDMDQIVAMSRFGGEVIQSGLPGRSVHVIYHGVDTDRFYPLKNRRELKSHERFQGKFVVGCVARNQPRKIVPALVRAFGKLRERFPDVHLYLHMSPCDIGFDLVTMLRRYHLEGSADLSGPDVDLYKPLRDEQLNRLYNLFDVMALPTMAEGFGLPILESMSAGVPVVATDYSACRELVAGRGELAKVKTLMTAGPNLIEHALVDEDDLTEKLTQLYLDPKQRLDYGLRGREFAESVTWDSLMPQWHEIFRCCSVRL